MVERSGEWRGVGRVRSGEGEEWGGVERVRVRRGRALRVGWGADKHLLLHSAGVRKAGRDTILVVGQKLLQCRRARLRAAACAAAADANLALLSRCAERGGAPRTCCRVCCRGGGEGRLDATRRELRHHVMIALGGFTSARGGAGGIVGGAGPTPHSPTATNRPTAQHRAERPRRRERCGDGGRHSHVVTRIGAARAVGRTQSCTAGHASGRVWASCRHRYAHNEDAWLPWRSGVWVAMVLQRVEVIFQGLGGEVEGDSVGRRLMTRGGTRC